MLIAESVAGPAAAASFRRAHGNTCELFGEVDALRCLALLPGTASGQPEWTLEPVDVLFSAGRYGHVAGEWLFRVGLWVPREHRSEFLSWYEQEHLPILLECSTWEGCRFVEAPRFEGMSIHRAASARRSCGVVLARTGALARDALVHAAQAIRLVRRAVYPRALSTHRDRRIVTPVWLSVRARQHRTVRDKGAAATPSAGCARFRPRVSGTVRSKGSCCSRPARAARRCHGRLACSAPLAARRWAGGRRVDAASCIRSPW